MGASLTLVTVMATALVAEMRAIGSRDVDVVDVVGARHRRELRSSART